MLRIGLCTGGGDCPGLNAAIRAVVRCAADKAKNIEIFGIENSITGLLNSPHSLRRLTTNDVSGILERGGTILGTSNSGSPFNNATNAQRVKDQFLKAWKKSKLDGLISIGGDGSQRIARQLHNIGIKTIGIPKTIDNDFAPTELSVGFSTAVEVVSEAIGRLHSTAEAHSRLMVVEVMGRHAGFIALHSGIASGAHVVLIPEIPYDYDAIVKKIKERQKRDRRFCVIIVAEGAHEKGTKPTFRSSATGTVHLGGIADEVARQLHKRTKIDARVTVLGHVQRGGSPGVADRILASMFGAEAVHLASVGKFGRVVCLQRGHVTSVHYDDIKDEGVANVSKDSFFIKTAEALGICLGR